MPKGWIFMSIFYWLALRSLHKSFQEWKVHITIAKCCNFLMPANGTKGFINYYFLLNCNIFGIIDAFAHDTNVLAHLIIICLIFFSWDRLIKSELIWLPIWSDTSAVVPSKVLFAFIKKTVNLSIDTNHIHHIRCLYMDLISSRTANVISVWCLEELLCKPDPLPWKIISVKEH